jgi:glycosyltransferase involved in cell wall biosynthesis
VKKVLIITYYWPPSGGAGVQRWLKFAKYLPEFGIEPYVLTVDPGFASYPQTDKSLVEEVPGNLKVFKTRSLEVLRIISGLFGKDQVPYGGFSNIERKGLLQTVLRFIRGNFFIPDARVGWKRYALKKARDLIRQYDIRTIITTGPPHSTHLIGLKLKKKLPVKWIADFRDPWTDIYFYSDMLHTPVAKSIDRRKEKEVLENADMVIAINKSTSELLKSKINIRGEDKFSVITNGYDEDDFNYPALPGGEFIITYSGNLSEHYRPRVFFKALARVKALYTGIRFRFRVAGCISSFTERQIREHGLDDIYENLGYVSHQKLTGLLKTSTVLLYSFPVTISYSGSSGKLYEYLAAERPVISLDSPGSDAAAIIKECEAGKNFSRDDEAGMFEYLCHLVEIFRHRGEVKAGNGLHRKYSRKNLTADLSRLLQAAAWSIHPHSGD